MSINDIWNNAKLWGMQFQASLSSLMPFPLLHGSSFIEGLVPSQVPEGTEHTYPTEYLIATHYISKYQLLPLHGLVAVTAQYHKRLSCHIPLAWDIENSNYGFYWVSLLQQHKAKTS